MHNCVVNKQQLDATVNKMACYAEKLGGLVNSTLVGLALTLSKDVGILQVLLDAQKPLTSHEIAGERDLKERYVRELLGSLATAEVIHVSTNGAGSLVYHLEEDEKQAFRTELTGLVSYSLAMMKAYDTIKACVSSQGPYGNRMSKEFHDSLEEFGRCHADTYVDSILRCVDGLKPKLESGIDVIEFGCGRGQLLVKIAQMFPKSVFIASDNVDALQEQMKSTMSQLPNISYDFIDLCSSSPGSRQYDWVICVHVIHDVPNPPAALKNIRNLLKPGGTFTMIDMAPSGSPLADRGNLFVAALYAISSFCCVAESYQREDSHAKGTCWGKQNAIELLTNAGFDVKTVDFEYPKTLYVCT